MTDIQEKMQALIRREELDRAFDARFPLEMKEKFSKARSSSSFEIRACIFSCMDVIFSLLLQNKVFRSGHLPGSGYFRADPGE